jgi:hypothetical protein
MKVCDHASSRIRRAPRIFRYSGGRGHGSSTVTANAGHPRSTLREAARGWPVSRRSPERMYKPDRNARGRADISMLAVLNGREPLLLPPGSVLQFGDPLGQLVVTKVGVFVGEEGGVVCVEAEPEPGQYPVLSRLDHPTQRAGHYGTRR